MLNTPLSLALSPVGRGKLPSCDTPSMAVFSRRLRRWDIVRIGAAAAGLAWLGLIGAFGYAAISQRPTTAGLAAAAAALLIAAAGILYAWREPGR